MASCRMNRAPNEECVDYGLSADLRWFRERDRLETLKSLEAGTPARVAQNNSKRESVWTPLCRKRVCRGGSL